MSFVNTTPSFKHIAVALAATLALAAPGQAQSSDCKAQWTGLVDILHGFGVTQMPSGALVRNLAGGQCRVGGVTLPLTERSKLSVQSVTWGGEQMDRFVNDGLPPTSLRMLIEGLRLGAPSAFARPTTPEEQLAKSTFNVPLAFDWDSETNTLVLQQFGAVVSGAGDYASLQATFAGVDLASKASLQTSLGSLALTNARLEIKFADFLVPIGSKRPFGRDLWGSSKDKAEQSATMRATIQSAPETLLSAASKEGLIAFFEATPTPRGTLRLAVQSDPGLGIARFLPIMMGTRLDGADALWDLLSDVRIDITYDPE